MNTFWVYRESHWPQDVLHPLSNLKVHQERQNEFILTIAGYFIVAEALFTFTILPA
jgi:hypothetical protein